MSASFAYMSQSKLRIKGALLILDDTLIYTFKRKCLQNTRKKKKKGNHFILSCGHGHKCSGDHNGKCFKLNKLLFVCFFSFQIATFLCCREIKEYNLNVKFL